MMFVSVNVKLIIIHYDVFLKIVLNIIKIMIFKLNFFSMFEEYFHSYILLVIFNLIVILMHDLNFYYDSIVLLIYELMVFFIVIALI